MRLFLKDGLRLLGIGLAIGLAGGVGVSRLLAAMLVDLNPLDLPTFAGVPLLLAIVAMLAAYLLARCAARIDPLAVLRHE